METINRVEWKPWMGPEPVEGAYRRPALSVWMRLKPIPQSQKILFEWVQCHGGKINEYLLGDTALADHDLEALWAKIRIWSDDPDESYVHDLLAWKYECRVTKDGRPWPFIDRLRYEEGAEDDDYPNGFGWGGYLLYREKDE